MNSDLKSEVRQPRELSNRVLGLLAISSMLLSAVSAIPLVFDMPDSLAWTKSLICPEGYHLDVKVWEESDSDHRGRTYTRIDPYCVAKMGRTIAAPPWMPFYAVVDRAPRDFPWLNEPEGGIVTGWRSQKPRTVYTGFNTM
jgi:hypothetical protein